MKTLDPRLLFRGAPITGKRTVEIGGAVGIEAESIAEKRSSKLATSHPVCPLLDPHVGSSFR